MIVNFLRKNYDWLLSLLKGVDPYIRVFFDRRTPWTARIVLGLALGYLLSPIDVIPDVIPVIGQLDDILIIAVLLYVARSRLPDGLKREYWPEKFEETEETVKN